MKESNKFKYEIVDKMIARDNEVIEDMSLLFETLTKMGKARYLAIMSEAAERIDDEHIKFFKDENKKQRSKPKN